MKQSTWIERHYVCRDRKLANGSTLLGHRVAGPYDSEEEAKQERDRLNDRMPDAYCATFSFPVNHSLPAN